MNSQHPNAQQIMRWLEAFNANDLDRIKALFTEKLVYRVSGRGPISREYRGVTDYVTNLLGWVKQHSDNTVTFTPVILLADDHAVMLLARITAQRGGKQLEGQNIFLFRFDDAGECIEGRTIPLDQYAFDEFWS
jgi:ketosteroid isomerase-like protein